jgi:hypothetical protein
LAILPGVTEIEVGNPQKYRPPRKLNTSRIGLRVKLAIHPQELRFGTPENRDWEKLATRRRRDLEKVCNPEGKRSGESWQPGEKEIHRKLAIWRKREPPKLDNLEKLAISREEDG